MVEICEKDELNTSKQYAMVSLGKTPQCIKSRKKEKIN